MGGTEPDGSAPVSGHGQVPARRDPWYPADGHGQLPTRRNPRHLGGHRRRASFYVPILGAVMLVMVTGLAAVTVVRITARSAEDGNHSMAARLYAQSAIELGFLIIRDDPDWRTNWGSGPWIVDQPIGTGTLSLAAQITPDGDGRADNDPVELIGTGISGPARQRVFVTVTPRESGMVTLAGA